MTRTCREQLLVFLSGKDRNSWLQDKNLKVYVRKSTRMIGADLVEALDIANITAARPGRGHGTGFINWAHSANPYPVTYIENVLNEGFAEHLARNGWEEQLSLTSRDKCFFKRRD